jgi:hypothetical protein
MTVARKQARGRMLIRRYRDLLLQPVVVQAAEEIALLLE